MSNADATQGQLEERVGLTSLQFERPSVLRYTRSPLKSHVAPLVFCSVAGVSTGKGCCSGTIVGVGWGVVAVVWRAPFRRSAVINARTATSETTRATACS